MQKMGASAPIFFGSGGTIVAEAMDAPARPRTILQCTVTIRYKPTPRFAYRNYLQRQENFATAGALLRRKEVETVISGTSSRQPRKSELYHVA